MADGVGAPVSCFVCEKHRLGSAAPGGIIYEDEIVYAGHAYRVAGSDDVYLGYLIAEPKRHVVGLGELTDDEAASLGRLVNDLARVLRSREGAEHVYSFVAGDGGVEHLHVHVVPRYRGTPPDYRGLRVTQWPGAPRGGIDAVVVTCDRIRAGLAERPASGSG
jgi:diadenosine tetraphosphate (Ap4A) HIT family hydrolase